VNCPRSGYVILRDQEHTHVMPTVCKTWGCLACQKKLETLYKLRTEYGCSEAELSVFITVTYVMGSRDIVDASSAVRDLRKLWQRLRRRGPWKDVAWCRVTELTNKGQVHHHLIAHGVKKTPRCVTTLGSRNAGYTSWYKGACKAREGCMNHELAREWHRITGDSYVVDVDVVRSKKAVADYLSEYITKGYGHWDSLVELGFKRRWNCSRNWPSPGRMRLRGSQAKNVFSVWKEVERASHGLMARKRELGSRARHSALDCPNIQQVGYDLTAPLRAKTQLRKIEKMIRRKST